MRSLASSLSVLLALAASCTTGVGGSTGGERGDDSERSGVTLASSEAAPGAPRADAPRTDGADADADDDAESDDGDDASTDGGDGVDNGGSQPESPPPAEQEQRCQRWEDCGPHFADLNSGFDCDAGVCTCDAEGVYDAECASIGGVWSPEECFCFVTSSRPPAPANDADRGDDEPYCWWTWHEECEPDEWVDTSYYRRECDDQGCRDRYVNRGYWRSGDCDDIWTKRCDDGTVQEHR